MHEAPYVRNAPLLTVRTAPRGDGIQLVGGDWAVELGADLAAAARHLATTWNFHDPLVDALRALLAEPTDAGTAARAKQVLAALDRAEV